MEKTIIWGHRGAGVRDVENSMASFQKAIDWGVDGIKTEANLTKDGSIVLIYPSNFRLNGDARKIGDYTLDEVKKVKLANGESIPTLTELFETFGDYDLLFNFDIWDIKVGEKIIEIAKKFHLVDRIEIAKPATFRGSFDDFLIPLRKKNKRFTLVNSCYNFNQLIENNFSNLEKMKNCGVDVVNLSHHSFNYEVFLRVKEEGFKFYLWSVLFQYFMKKYLKLNTKYGPVDAIMTNYPDKLLKLRKKIQGV
jgi:glycerophosphoryl diester phosphodiesterase